MRLSADNDTAIMFSTVFVGEADGRAVRRSRIKKISRDGCENAC